MNEVFGTNFEEVGILEHSYMVITRVKENQEALNQIKNNDIDQIMYGDLPSIVDDAMIDIEKSNDKKKELYLSNEEVREKYIRVIYKLIRKLLENDQLGNFNLEHFLKGMELG